MNPTTYHSLIDWWLLAILFGIPALTAGIGIFLRTKKKRIGNIIIGLSLAYGIMIALLSFPCAYTLRENDILIKCGLLVNRTIPYEKIESIEPTKDSRSAPALSMNRIKMELKNGGSAVISPKNQAQFIDDILKRKKGVKSSSRGL